MKLHELSPAEGSARAPFRRVMPVPLSQMSSQQKPTGTNGENKENK